MKISPDDATKYLQYLSIGHYILGAFIALVGCFPLLHLVMGVALTTAGIASHASHDPGAPLFEFIGPMFIVIAGAIIAAFWTLATLVFLNGRFLAQRKNHLFCIVVSFIEAIFFTPIGTVLGVLAIIVLIDDATKASFSANAPPVAAPPGEVSP